MNNLFEKLENIPTEKEWEKEKALREFQKKLFEAEQEVGRLKFLIKNIDWGYPDG